MRILITGDREYNRKSVMRRALEQYDPATDVILHGGARGADSLGGIVAKELGFTVEPPYMADWQRYGRAAGVIRNREMLDTCPDLVIAFHDDLDNSKGTKDCITEARKRGIKVILHTYVGELHEAFATYYKLREEDP